MQGKNGHANGQLPAIAVVRRHCNKCGGHRRVTIMETPDGWEIWNFQKCGHQQRYKVK